MQKAKIDRLARKIDFVQKNTSFSPILVDTNLSYLTLEGPGRQTVDTGASSVHMTKHLYDITFT